MYKRAKSPLVFNLLVVLILALVLPSAAFAQGPEGGFTATPLTPDSAVIATKSQAAGGALMVPVVVKLEGASLASYSGGVPGLAPTNPAVTGETGLNPSSARSQAYLRYLDSKQSDFVAAALAAIPGARVTSRLDVVVNAVAMTVPAGQVDALAALPGVAAVYPDELLQPQTDNSPQFIGAPAVWAQLGGQESSGEGVIVGVLDTGVWPEHPSFSDPDPSGKAYAAPPAAPSGQPRACQFNGGANPGPAFTCNNKLIGAQRFMNAYDANIAPVPGEYTSARDDNGHGTHTSSTAAGNAGVAASIFGVARGTVSGIAPRAHVIMYKVCGASGCASSDSAAAVQQAIKDGVNVINFSISGGANPYTDVSELAFLDAYSAGIFVAVSAGNSGPGSDTTDHRGPWVTTVAASTQDRQFANNATLTADGGATLTVQGASITAGVGPAPVFVPSGTEADLRCDNPLPAGSVAGKIVVCKRGVTGRAQKGYNVLQGGAVGMILYNNATNVTDLETDNHWLPATHIQFADGTKVLDFMNSHTNVQATLTAGKKEAAQGDVMASFSSRGGPGQSIGVSKPDITAPGVQILAGASPQHVPPPDGVAEGPQGELFQAIAGTSMSSPHIAGSGALLKALHPNWTPGQIKSALMMTAKTEVVKEDGSTPATPFDYGSGRVDLTKAGDPGLTIDASALDYVAHQSDLWNANYPSIYIPRLTGVVTVQRTVHNQTSSASQWNLSVLGAAGFSVSVQNSLLQVPANGNATFSITIDARDVPVGQARSATLLLTSGARTLHIPITFVR
ncbi:MAG: S8 family serine peptidase, partial [Nitrososphaerales archaeon]